MAAKDHAKDARFFLSRANCANEYTDYDARLIEVRQRSLVQLYCTYVPLFKTRQAKKDGFFQIALNNHWAVFVNLHYDEMPNMAGLEPYVKDDERWVELPRETFEMLETRTEQDHLSIGYSGLNLSDAGLVFEALDRHSDDQYQSEYLYWTDLGLRRKPKPRK